MNWEECAKESGELLMEAGDLFRECYAFLEQLGSDAGDELANKIKAFCDRVHNQLTS